ncbi:hydrophobic surface binding protein A-domain-containing protein [Mycena metata]|uniref:Hydrophobic surface binding protein A-domain-containing protein n=1 Tax=Mycena metata TaxID=1033252 RepID=A0AAD7NMJ4_9AGAR|nr:hydrophobic surface binding protein A-domain-containing protein [Mycena metata]
MVQLPTLSLLSLSLSFLFARGYSISFKRSAVQLETDISTVAAEISSLDTQVTAFPATGGSLLQVLATHTAITNLEGGITTATTDLVAAGPLDEVNATAIVTALQDLVPVFLDALNKLSIKEPSVAAASSAGKALFLSDLKNLKAATDLFLEDLAAAVPPDLQEEVREIQEELDGGFGTAITAYS